MKINYPSRNYIKVSEVEEGELFCYQVHDCIMIKTKDVDRHGNIISVNIFTGEVYNECGENSCFQVKATLNVES